MGGLDVDRHAHAGVGMAPWALSVILRGAVGVDEGEEGVDVAGLDPDFALAGELADEAFAAEEEGFEFAAGAEAGKDGDVVLEGVFEGDDVAGIDDVLVGDVDFEDGAVGVEEDVARAGGFEEDESFSAEEAAGALPLAGHFDAFAVEHVGAPLEVEAEDYPPALREPRATFVTLRRNDALRGCIGVIEARQPLVVSVAEVAFKSAFRDPRFAPLTEPELEGLCIEIEHTSNHRDHGHQFAVVGQLEFQLESGFLWVRPHPYLRMASSGAQVAPVAVVTRLLHAGYLVATEEANDAGPVVGWPVTEFQQESACDF